MQHCLMNVTETKITNIQKINIMKKLFYLMLALPLFMVSCSDDDDMPNVDITATFEGGTQVDGSYYVVQGDTLKVTGMSLINYGKDKATIGGVRYFLDYMPIGTSIVSPYGINIVTDNLPVGNHLLQAEMPVYAVGYSMCTGYMAKKITIVQESADVPDVTVPDTGTEKAVFKSGDSK